MFKAKITKVYIRFFFFNLERFLYSLTVGQKSQGFSLCCLHGIRWCWLLFLNAFSLSFIHWTPQSQKKKNNLTLNICLKIYMNSMTLYLTLIIIFYYISFNDSHLLQLFASHLLIHLSACLQMKFRVQLQCKNLHEYLKELSPEVLDRLYNHPATCLAVYRSILL